LIWPVEVVVVVIVIVWSVVVIVWSVVVVVVVVAGSVVVVVEGSLVAVGSVVVWSKNPLLSLFSRQHLITESNAQEGEQHAGEHGTVHA